jgi:uncharacterized protein YndB with AHSA1/START domain
MTATANKVSGGKKAKLTITGERELTVVRDFDAPRDRVWRAYTDPKQVAQWWGRGNKLEVERFELERGGHWRFVEHSEGQRHGFEGRFRKVEPQDLLEMTFEWDGMPGHASIDSNRFTDLEGGRTRITVVSTFFTKEDMDGMMSSGMEDGMNQSYEALDRVLASRK